ncbi:hypothetical protein PFICI_15040 [Pestalotiopsis fici W106-1]|uniref:Uncharacterized protein n=1 Tax=Pestalotiopsis fici (strain W106-1 / CGMCC3.15140) TaxID=1229662 RepID=W3WHM5_PESFW|nr:uncharacterized protein PFICI_15040 [Pestalotiopsis fici W106-1]ETS73435.1 hypothetical protein PFICI_15040 [Pestalotiopsis fici W106-1]
MATNVQRWVCRDKPACSKLKYLRDIVPENMRKVKSVDGGLHFVTSGAVRFADQPDRIAGAIPSLLAPMLAQAALRHDIDENGATLKSFLQNWSKHSVLLDMTLEDEAAIRSKLKGINHDYPMNQLFAKKPSLMPKALPTWHAESTTVKISGDVIVVVFKDNDGVNLMRVSVDATKLETPFDFGPLVLMLLILVVVVVVSPYEDM